MVGAVGDVAGVGFLARRGPEAVPLVFVLGDVVRVVSKRPAGVSGLGALAMNGADRKAEHIKNGTVPPGVTLGEVVVDGDKMRSESPQTVQVQRQGRDEGFPLAGFHLRDSALVQDYPADHLDIEMPQAESPNGGFPDHRECLGQKAVEFGSAGEPFSKLIGLAAKLLIVKGLHRGFKGVDLFDDFAKFSYLTLIGAEKCLEEAHLFT